MMEALAAAPNEGKAELPTLASELQLEADELLPIAETLQLMRFAEIEGRMIRLTPAAKRYAVAEVDARKQLFAHQLLAYAPSPPISAGCWTTAPPARRRPAASATSSK